MAMDTIAMTNTSGAPTAIVAEAGSREAPALPPGLLTEVGEAGAAVPTKLFIGGISRHTTTKQLRDHFSAFGRVLDCVAMRQPDGRPRGFGYVTLDSPTAAERCLREPQLIDNRIVDMKAAVPEGSGSYAGSPSYAGSQNMYAGQGDFGMDMFAGHGFNGWPEGSDSFGNSMSWWNGARASPQGQGLDCLQLLSAARDLAVSNASSPHGLPLHSIGLSDYAECATGGWDDDEPQSMLIPAEFQQPPGASGKMSTSAKEFVPMSASAKEFVPMAVQAQLPSPKVAEPQKAPAATPARKAATTRAPLGELSTNVIVEVEDLLKPFKSPTNKLADIGRGHLSSQLESPAAKNGYGIGRAARPTGLLLDDEDMDSASPSSGAGSSGDIREDSSPEPLAAKAEEESSDSVSNGDECQRCEDNDESLQPPGSSDDGSDVSEGDDVVVDMDNLPSMGSAQHAAGECKRCNFFPKGRCQNGKNCQFCHYPHDKRKPSRQEKRERRAAWLDGHEGQDSPSTDEQSPMAKVGPLLSEMRPEVVQQLANPFLFKHGLYPGGFPVYPEEELYRDETLAYSIFPGLPPIHATKLPAPLPLPGMDMAAQTGPVLPPGLRGPAASTQPWQPEVEASPASFLGFDQRGYQQALFSTAPRSLAPFATSPSVFSTSPTPSVFSTTPALTPMSTPVATPTAAMARASAEGKTGPALPPGLVEPEAGSSVPRTLAPIATALAHLSTTPMTMPLATRERSMSTSTSGTQTGDYKCRQCDLLQEATTAGSVDNEPTGCEWARDELLRLRDGLMKLPEFSKKSSSYSLRTAAIVASASN